MPNGGRKRPPAAVLSSSLVLPGGLDAGDVLQGTSAVARLPPEHNPAIGAPVTAPLDAPAGFPYPIAPRALLLAMEAAGQLQLANFVGFAGFRAGRIVFDAEQEMWRNEDAAQRQAKPLFVLFAFLLGQVVNAENLLDFGWSTGRRKARVAKRVMISRAASRGSRPSAWASSLFCEAEPGGGGGL